ncbi:hypothetical protein FAES_3303 [Fibrella aestuarina BUZ 2]|uniref:Portal protein n=1 Tax=Fibrella aestuarina BUZ 2 TaxID=1166018 RepID=I0KB08_9BACT|nr:hypothetical protein [Fibrella aestuarina]CCH01311.1 hypothetical protein FAES_3303 [Fibrella aestuarina BUZ 2]
MQTLLQQHEENYRSALLGQSGVPAPVYGAITSYTSHVLNQPVLTWRDAFAKKPAELIRHCQQLSDVMLLNPHPLYGSHNPNKPYQSEVAAGKLRRDDYDPMLLLFGQGPVLPLKDNHFFEEAKKTLIAQIIGQPIEFSASNISQAFAKQSILDDADRGAAMLTQALFGQMASEGDGAARALINPKIKVPKAPDDWLAYATGVEQVEGIMTKLLKHLTFQPSFRRMVRATLGHKFDLNAQAVHLDVRKGTELVAEPVHPNQVRWLSGGRPIETLHDPSVFACQVNDYMTLSELFNRYGTTYFTKPGTGLKGVFSFFESLENTRKYGLPYYDPHASYFTEQGYSALWTPDGSAVPMQYNWMNNLFYPAYYMGNRLQRQMLVQRNYFTMLREKRFLVHKVENGQRSRPTKREIEAWRVNRANISHSIDFSPLADKDKGAGGLVMTYGKPELWTFLRVGHADFFDIGPYEHQPDWATDTSERDRINWPIALRVSYDKSMVKLGEEDAVKVNILHQKINQFVAGMGYEEALIVDDVHGHDPITYLYNIKQSGVVRIDSSEYERNNPAALKHLTTVKVSNDLKQIADLFMMIRTIKQGYEVRVGNGADVQGAGNPYQSATKQQMNLAGQQLLNVDFNMEHNDLMTQVLQTAADILKFLYAKDADMVVRLSEREQQVLRLTTSLSLADFGIYLQSGKSLADKKQLLTEMVKIMAASASAEEYEALMTIQVEDNPTEGLAKLRQINQQQQQRKADEAAAGQKTAEIQLQQQREKQQFDLALQEKKNEGDKAVAEINERKELKLKEMELDYKREHENESTNKS